jgi:hypothetical protein
VLRWMMKQQRINCHPLLHHLNNQICLFFWNFVTLNAHVGSHLQTRMELDEKKNTKVLFAASVIDPPLTQRKKKKSGKHFRRKIIDLLKENKREEIEQLFDSQQEMEEFFMGDGDSIIRWCLLGDSNVEEFRILVGLLSQNTLQHVLTNRVLNLENLLEAQKSMVGKDRSTERLESSMAENLLTIMGLGSPQLNEIIQDHVSKEVLQKLEKLPVRKLKT